MTEVQFRSSMGVSLVDSMGNDRSVVRAARVSTVGANEGQGGDRLIAFLMREKHMSPFEHATFTFLVEAPIFTINQMVRHRIASFNIESGRYKELEPVFYVPGIERPVVQVGKTGDYTFETGTGFQRQAVFAQLANIADESWNAYQNMLNIGAAKEVARMVLPLNIYSSLYVTMNARGLMNFLSLRNEHHAQHEIRQVAKQMEDIFAEHMPLTHKAFRG